ncbi:restriction endonuclease subunit S [Staphylococcus saprophyticus]|nr:restriction endonuclease subunit S [Staphylococcus saprophyticus]
MTNQTKNVPELRFPDYQNPWENINLGKATTKIGSGKTPLGGNSVYSMRGIPFLRSQNIQNGKLNLNELVYIDKITDEKMKNSRTYFGDILLNITGASIGRCTVNTLKDSHANLNQHVCIIRLKEIYDYYFIGYYLISQKGQKKIFMSQSGGSREGLNFKEIGRIKFMLPTDINEQQKIGEFFSKLDQQIELEEKKLELLEQQKRGYMQKIFSQELRFKDENGNTFEEWKNTNFNYFMSEPDNLEKGIDLRKDQLLTVKLEGRGVSKANINRALKMGSTVYYKRFAGQFIYGKQNFFNGAFGIVPKFLNNYYSSGDVPALNIDYSKIDSKYFINYISRKDYYKKKEAFSTGTGSKRIHEKTLLDFDIMLPSVEEQEKIGDFFSEIDNFIEKQSYKVELLKERKKGFLQKMFV